MKYCVLDMGGTFIKSAVMDEQAHILGRRRVKSDCSGPDAMLNSLDQIIGPMMGETAGIAVSMPGRIDVERGVAETGGAFDFIRNQPMTSLLEERYHLPVTIENDGKAAAIAESWMGALKDVSNGLVFILGTGIAGGIILNHQVYRGSHFAAGELSLCLVDGYAEDFDVYNLTGRVSSTRGLLNLYRSMSGQEEETDGVTFFDRVNSGEEASVKTLSRFGRITANYIFNLQAVLDLERIAVGGGISEQPVLLKVLNEELDRLYDQPLPLPCVRPELVKCRFGNDANLVGALKVLLDSGKVWE